MKDKLKQRKIMKENVIQRKMTHEKEKAIGGKATECERRKRMARQKKTTQMNARWRKAQPSKATQGKAGQATVKESKPRRARVKKIHALQLKSRFRHARG